jgi:hypothetical protein
MTRPSRRHTLDLISEGHFTYHPHNPPPALRRTLGRATLSGCACGWSSEGYERAELVPQNPDDGPASVLLERIRAEREGKEQEKHVHPTRLPGT